MRSDRKRYGYSRCPQSDDVAQSRNAADRTRTFRPASLNTIYPVAKVVALTDGLVRPVIIAAQMGALVQEEL